MSTGALLENGCGNYYSILLLNSTILLMQGVTTTICSVMVDPTRGIGRQSSCRRLTRCSLRNDFLHPSGEFTYPITISDLVPSFFIVAKRPHNATFVYLTILKHSDGQLRKGRSSRVHQSWKAKYTRPSRETRLSYGRRVDA